MMMNVMITDTQIKIPFFLKYWFWRRCSWSQARSPEYQSLVDWLFILILEFPGTALFFQRTWKCQRKFVFGNFSPSFCKPFLDEAVMVGILDILALLLTDGFLKMHLVLEIQKWEIIYFLPFNLYLHKFSIKFYF